jgi:hypothetical protein
MLVELFEGVFVNPLSVRGIIVGKSPDLEKYEVYLLYSNGIFIIEDFSTKEYAVEFARELYKKVTDEIDTLTFEIEKYIDDGKKVTENVDFDLLMEELDKIQREEKDDNKD